MKIAVMMRAMDQNSGLKSYVEGLMEALLRIDERNSYLLLYRDPKTLGRFGGRGNVHELLVKAPHKLLWDQVAVPYVAWREHADIIFNPKFSVPLVSHCPVAMGLQEPAWWTEPQYYERFDVVYNRVMLPLYCRKASQLFPMSNFILDENRKYLGLAFPGAIVTHTVPGPQFHPIADAEILGDVRARYRLPERIILNPTRVDHPGLDHSDSFYGGKNPETALRAFAMCREEIPHDLVFAGRRVREYFLHLGFAGKDFDRVHFVGCVSRDDLAALYNLADLTVIPSFYEGCPANVMQALACGCPVLASCTGGSREVCGGAGLLADPHNTADFASKMRAVLTDPELKARLVSDGLERAKFFDWSRTATLTLDGLTRAALGHRWQESEKAVRDLGIHHR